MVRVQAEVLARTLLDQGRNGDDVEAMRPKRRQLDPARLRGFPIQTRGVGGAIRGSRPAEDAVRNLERESGWRPEDRRIPRNPRIGWPDGDEDRQS